MRSSIAAGIKANKRNRGSPLRFLRNSLLSEGCATELRRDKMTGSDKRRTINGSSRATFTYRLRHARPSVGPDRQHSLLSPSWCGVFIPQRYLFTGFCVPLLPTPEFTRYLTTSFAPSALLYPHLPSAISMCSGGGASAAMGGLVA